MLARRQRRGKEGKGCYQDMGSGGGDDQREEEED